MIEIRRILCPVDFSEYSARALEHAAAFARGQEAEVVVLLHVAEGFSSELHAAFDFTEARRRLEEDARARLGRVVQEPGSAWCDPDPEVRFGKPGEQIVRAARERGSELVVMGARGRGPLARLFLGSTVHHVVRATDRPVLTVRTRQAVPSEQPPPSGTHGIPS